MKKTHNNLAFGAQAVAAALVFNSGQLAAQDTSKTCEQDTSIECETPQSDEAIERIKIHGVQDSVYLFEKSGDLRRVADLVDTPQVITVLSQDQIQEAGQTDLKEILAGQAGVTLGTGENGNAFGDRYIIRGHEARSDVFVDGLRDPGMTTRESFATERVEITKGPSSTFAGRGSSGGAVNNVTKKASTAYNFGRVDGSLGTDEYTRLTLDYNAALTDDVAVRVNLLTAAEDKPGREGTERERNGLQLSGILHASDKLNFTADVYYLDASDLPDLGSSYDQILRSPVKDIPVYAQQEDFIDSEVSTFTFRTEYEISDNLRITNSTRVGSTENGYITTGLRSSNSFSAGDSDTFSLSTHQGWQKVDYTASQTNLFFNTQALGFEHQWVFGLEYSDEEVENGVYDIAYGENSCADPARGNACTLPNDLSQVDNITGLMQRSFQKGNPDSHNKVKTISIYAMDTINLTEKTQAFFGYRQDSFDYSNDVVTRSGDELAYDLSDTMHNGHIGIVHEIMHDANVYLTYSTATNINGGESDIGASCGYGGLCGDPDQAKLADPETVENIELGTKWLVADDSLMLNAAIFKMTKSDVMESVGSSYSTLGTLNTGENEITGIELGAAGNITDQLSIQFSAAMMESEVTKAFNPDHIGLRLSNFAEDSMYLQLRYQLTDDFSFGGDMTYQGEMSGGQPDTASDYDIENDRYRIVVPSFTVFNLFANYNATEKLTLRANIGNVSDKEYWTAAYRSGSFMYLGDGQSARLTATYQF